MKYKAFSSRAMAHQYVELVVAVSNSLAAGNCQYICRAIDDHEKKVPATEAAANALGRLREEINMAINPHQSVEQYLANAGKKPAKGFNLGNYSSEAKKWRLHWLWGRLTEGRDALNSLDAKGGPHKHAKLMMQFAMDALESKEPWKKWEFSMGREWRTCNSSPKWLSEHEYRRKRGDKFIMIGKNKVPAPLTEDEVYPGMVVWVIRADAAIAATFSDKETSGKILANGQVFASKEDAELAHSAITAVLRQEPVEE